MRFKKKTFSRQTFGEEKKRSRQILSQNNSAQIQGMKKRNHEIFGVFQNLEMKFLKIIFFKNFFFFLKIYFERKFSPDFGKSQDFVFVSTGFELKSFPPGKDSKMNLSLLEKD